MSRQPNRDATFAYQLSPYLVSNRDGTVSNLLTNRRWLASGLRIEQLCDDRGIVDCRRLRDISDWDESRMARVLADLASSRIVFPSHADPFVEYGTRFVDIETCTDCNALCWYCPASIRPKSPEFMPSDVFRRVIQEVAASLDVEWVSLNHYNEPLLDPHFAARVRLISDYSLRLRLFTNATLLTMQHVELLVETGVLESLVVNLPSPKPAMYKRATGIAMPPDLLGALLSAADRGLAVSICVNDTPSTLRAGRDAVVKSFRSVLGSSIPLFFNVTHDRAGLLPDLGLVSGVGDSRGLGGCRRLLQHAAVSVRGDVFMCCQDYDQEHIFGSLVAERLPEILRGSRASAARRAVFGGDTQAAKDLPCARCIERLDPRDNVRLRATGGSNQHVQEREVVRD